MPPRPLQICLTNFVKLGTYIIINQAMHKAEFDKFADEYHVLHQKNIRLSGVLWLELFIQHRTGYFSCTARDIYPAQLLDI